MWLRDGSWWLWQASYATLQIGDDDATMAFSNYWHSQASLVGSKLAYNTGRSLDKFLALLEEKRWCLAGSLGASTRPYVYTSSQSQTASSAVSARASTTKRYSTQAVLLSIHSCIALAQDGQWVEDADYLTFLDTDWDVGVMRDAAYRALNAVGDDVMHFRPPDEQNDHKITCGVMVRSLLHVRCCDEQCIDNHRWVCSTKWKTD